MSKRIPFPYNNQENSNYDEFLVFFAVQTQFKESSFPPLREIPLNVGFYEQPWGMKLFLAK